jgi:DNA-binding NtrC family response regulator
LIEKLKSKEQFKVFIVDDSALCRFIYNKHLSNMGFKNIYMFENSAECLSNIHIVPDLILLDFDAPPGNGLDVVKEVKKQYPQIHMLMISAQKEVKVVVDAIRNGVSGYIMKDENQLDMVSYETERFLDMQRIQIAC